MIIHNWTRLFITGDTWHFHPQWPYFEACFSVYLSCFSVLHSFFVWLFGIVFSCTVELLLLKKRGILTCLGLQNLLWFELCFCCFHMTKKLFSFPWSVYLSLEMFWANTLLGWMAYSSDCQYKFNNVRVGTIDLYKCAQFETTKTLPILIFIHFQLDRQGNNLINLWGRMGLLLHDSSWMLIYGCATWVGLNPNPNGLSQLEICVGLIQARAWLLKLEARM